MREVELLSDTIQVATALRNRYLEVMCVCVCVWVSVLQGGSKIIVTLCVHCVIIVSLKELSKLICGK